MPVARHPTAKSPLKVYAPHDYDQRAKRLRRRVEATLNLRQPYESIDAKNRIAGAGVVYIGGDYTVITLREFKPLCRRDPIRIVLREPTERIDFQEYATVIRKTPGDSRLITEGLNAALSCGGAVLTWFVVFGSTGAVPLSGGASAGVTVIAVSAAVATTAQCGNAIYRSADEIVNPQMNDYLDDQEWYRLASRAVDFVSLAGAGAAGLKTLKMLKGMRAKGIPLDQALRGLDRHQRARLTREVIRMKHPNVSNKMLKLAQRTGRAPKRYGATEISRATALQLKDAVSGGMAIGSSLTGGAIRSLAIGLHEEVD